MLQGEFFQKKREQKNNAKLVKQSKQVSAKTEGKLGKVYISICENKQAVAYAFWVAAFLDEMDHFLERNEAVDHSSYHP